MNLLLKPIFFIKGKFSERQFLITLSILVGLSSGLAAVILKYFVHSIGTLVTYSLNSGELLFVGLFPFFGLLLTIFFIKYFLNDVIKKGSAEIVYAVIKKSSLIRFKEVYGHLFTSAFTVGFGGSLGLESPIVSTGSAIGSNYAVTLGLSYKDRTMLLGCGAAAGIAAAFNSPIAGVLFVVEVLLTNVSAASFIPLIISAACGALLSKIILKEGVTLAFALQQPFSSGNVPYYILLGVLCGLTSLCYVRVFHRIETVFERLRNKWVRPVIAGVILFIIISLFPSLFGEGYEGVRMLEGKNPMALTDGSVLNSSIATETALLVFIGALVFFKMVAAAVTIGGGGNGGSFAPSLVVGSYIGFLFARVVNNLGMTNLPVSNFTLVAMAGILSGIFYAPLTAVFLIAEITGGYGLMIPLMIVSSLSLLVVHFFEPLSMEAKKLSIKLRSTVETRDKLLLSRLDLSELIETNFSIAPHDASLKELVKIISLSNRNTFPVVDGELKLIGLIHLDKIRSIMFNSTLYEKTVKELMETPRAIVELNENLHEVLSKFESTSQWNLPVVQDGVYLGFLSKSSILTRYRKELMDFS